jgi:hypothetical protein
MQLADESAAAGQYRISEGAVIEPDLQRAGRGIAGTRCLVRCKTQACERAQDVVPSWGVDETHALPTPKFSRGTIVGTGLDQHRDQEAHELLLSRDPRGLGICQRESFGRTPAPAGGIPLDGDNPCLRQHAEVIAYRVVMQVSHLTDELCHRQAVGCAGERLGKSAAHGMCQRAGCG